MKLFFFFKQKTAYEMRISDWSSDVCSSDLRETEELVRAGKPKKPRPGPVAHKDAHADIEALERQLGDMLGLRVKITHRTDGGTVALGYSSPEQLDMICPTLRGAKQTRPRRAGLPG